jgi:bile-acid 7alpha-dehydratase
MAEIVDLEARIKLLEKESRQRQDVEAIKSLKYKYWRCLDQKLMDELEECFAEDAAADYGPKIKLSGRSAVMRFLRESMSHLTGVHHGHNPEIELTSDTTAKATWALYNYMTDRETNKGIRIGGFYYDEYVKEKDEWRISSTTEVNVFREIFDR